MSNIKKELNKLGMNNDLKGYYYCKYAIELIIKLGFFVEINNVYVLIGDKFKTSGKNVERNIRYSIEKTWEKGNTENIDKMFGYSVDYERGKPTNREFLFMIADRVKNFYE